MVATISKPNNGLTTSRTKTPIQVSRKRKRLALIPADLKIRIDKLNIKPQSKESCLNLACYIYLACQKQADENNLWMPISQIHFEENVSTDYLKPLKKLKEAGIVECNEYYHYTEFKGEGQCKKYRIKPELLEAELVPVRYSNNKKNTYQNTPIVQQTLKNLEKLSIVIDGKTIKLESDLWKLKSIIENHINEDWFFRNCRINELQPNQVYDSYFWNINMKTDNINIFNGKTERLLELAELHKTDLILYKRKIILADAKKFATFKVKEIRGKIWSSIIAIYDKAWVCNRNTTNNRLDTNLTNLKSDYINLLRFEGEPLVSIDLKNSQFVIFAHLLEACWNLLCIMSENQVKNLLTEPQILSEIKGFKFKGEKVLKEGKIKEESIRSLLNIMCQEFFTNGSFSMSCDCSDFIRLTKSGKFYEAFGKTLMGQEVDNLSDKEDMSRKQRADAKRTMFLVAFSSYKFHSEDKSKFKVAFPYVSVIIDGFKREMDKLYIQQYKREEANEKANASFAVMLQNIESAIFIDEILPKLWKAGFKVFTKHDSFLVKESHAKEAEAFIRLEFDKIFGENEYRIAIE